MRSAALLLLFAVTGFAAADILHMRDGSRHYGILVAESQTEIAFRVTLPDGKSGTLRRFPRATVDRVELSPISRPPAEDAAEEADHQRDENAPAPEGAAALIAAFEKLDQGDKRDALRLLQRAVTRAKPDELADLERLTRERRAVALANLMADLRYETGLAPGRARLLRIAHATPYESEALGQLLEGKLTPLLAAEFGGRTIRSWIEDDQSYSELQPDARDMVNTARLAAGIAGARLRFDPRLKHDREARVALVKLQQSLARFAAEVSVLPGFTSLGTIDDPTDPGLIAARTIAATQPAASRPAASQPSRAHSAASPSAGAGVPSSQPATPSPAPPPPASAPPSKDDPSHDNSH